MESLPKLDTSRQQRPSSMRNSYDSLEDSPSSSARNSYASDTSATSTQSSNSSLPDSFQRISSFSRTSSELSPISTVSTTLSSRDSSPNSPQPWENAVPAMRYALCAVGEQAANNSRSDLPSSSLQLERQPKSIALLKSKDGPTTLRELQDVRNVVCVAFGAFDKYFISWEDNNGDFHQGMPSQ